MSATIKQRTSAAPATASGATTSKAKAAATKPSGLTVAGGSPMFMVISLFATLLLVRFVVLRLYADVNALALANPNSWLNFLCSLSTAPYGPYGVWENYLRVELPPETLRLINRGVFATWVGFAAMGLVATALDCFPSRFRRYKVQGAKNYFTVGQWCEAFGLSSLNVLVVSWAINVPLARLGLWLHGVDGASVEADAWTWYIEIPKFILCLPIVDVWPVKISSAEHCSSCCW